MAVTIQGRSPNLAILRLAILFGLFTGTAMASWILLTHGRPQWALSYHVPLAALIGCWLVRLAWDVTRRHGYASLAVTAVAFGLVLGRVFQGWPASGHAVVAGLVLVRGRWPWLRIAAGLVLLQTLLDKWVRDIEPMSAVIGALAGVLLGTLAHRLDGAGPHDRSRT